MDRPRGEVQRLPGVERGQRPLDRRHLDRRGDTIGTARPVQRIDVVDPAHPAAGAARHSPLPGEMLVQALADEADPEPQPALHLLQRGVPDLIRALDHALGQTEAVGEVDEVGRRQHHHRERHIGEGDLDRHLDGDGALLLERGRPVEGDNAARHVGDGRRGGGADRLVHVTSTHVVAARAVKKPGA